MNILADPVFSKKCGPGGSILKLGYTRFTHPACQVKTLPPIDVVIISHNHHDHLDSQSVRDIAKHHPNAIWLVGLGNFCVDKGCGNVEEMEWWESSMVWMGSGKPEIQYYLEPPQELEKQMYNNGLEPKTFFNLQIGETWIVGEDRDYDPPFMEREKRRTPRLNNGPGDLGATASGVLTTEAATEDRDYNPTFMEREKMGTPRFNNGPGDLGATSSGVLTTEAVTEDRDYNPPFMEREKRGTTRFNNGPGDLGATASGVLTTEVVTEDRNYDPPFMEREIRGTPRLNYDRPNGDLSGFTTVATLQDPLSMVDALCQDIKTENQVKKIECSHPRRISPDGPSSHNNHIDLATITVMEPTVPSKRSMARDAQWSHKTQEDSALVVKPTGRYKPRSMTIQEAFKAPWPHNNQEDSAIGMKPTGRSKPKRSLSPDAPLQRNNQDSDSGIKPTGSLARD
ncbi:NAPEP-like protein [Mya arenaria]|uniref:NAPEP-like protein n=1 Tax=Mya arenaria TaxID=6604 RepID=A0ABY7ESG5_MYAAR|nr:NAPEP-like protein [Mya arenaria]